MKRMSWAACLLAAATVHAQAPGVSSDRVLIGQTAGFSGIQAGTVKELTDGAKLYIDHVNSRGGVHGRRIEPGPQINEPAAVRPLALHHGRRGLAREAGGVEQIVVGEDAHRPGPFQSGERGLHRAAQRVIEGEQAGCLAGAQHEMREPFGPVGEGADDQRLGRSHVWEYTSRAPGVYSGIRTGKPACAWSGPPTAHRSAR